MKIRLLMPTLLLLLFFGVNAQKKGGAAPNANNLVYVDDQGILRWTGTRNEASFWGVNYTLPFAYSYRAHKALGVDPEQAIREDVYHLARLGLDAFRVHMWDTEISDSTGNLLENDHLRLFDFLLAELEKRGIRVILTPIAFWGNGYPERDERTPGFSRVYGKGRATVNDTAIRAQENYLQQLFRHVNPYTRRTYRDDPDIIAVELNNEPSHSGPGKGVTAYIDRLVAVMRNNGWTKPLFYNISQNPYYAGAVAASGVNGFSFQWYPTGLVAGHEIRGNFLANVDQYTIPFDTIPAFLHKPRMVYEFDAADILQSDMYPAVARSYRGAGFQWVTQFAYDPLHLAYANTEYQTHFLNLAYTPSKAISLLIASCAFHHLPLSRRYGSWPADSVFDAFRVSYRNDLSQLNTDTAFYYSNSTADAPVRPGAIVHVAGVGNSSVVRYGGYGAYFLDRLEAGVWRLEVMPDAITVRDPFERASPAKEVVRIQWETQPMRVALPDLGDRFSIRPLNEGNDWTASTRDGGFGIRPGAYLVVREGKESGRWTAGSLTGFRRLGEYVAPRPIERSPLLVYDPVPETSAGNPLVLHVKAVGLDSSDGLTLQPAGFGPFRPLPFQREGAYDYSVTLPSEWLVPGTLHYRIILQKGSRRNTWPGNYPGDPSDWDFYHPDTYDLFIAPPDARLVLYDAAEDKQVMVYPVFRRGVDNRLVPAGSSGREVLHLAEHGGSAMNASPGGEGNLLGFQVWYGDRMTGRKAELADFHRVVVRARSIGGLPVKARLTLVTRDAIPFSGELMLQPEFQDVELPVESLRQDSLLLLPRPYPGFLPLWFSPSGQHQFSPADAERLQMTMTVREGGMEVESIWMKK